MQTKEQLMGEIRYAIRLTQQTARLYRRIQTIGTFLTVVGGSAALAAFAGNTWVLIAGASIFAVFGAASIAIRPADKAAMNESDVKRYQSLMSKAQTMDVAQLRTAIEEAHIGDAPEIEALRIIAYNDVMDEINRQDQHIPLSRSASLLRAFA